LYDRKKKIFPLRSGEQEEKKVGGSTNPDLRSHEGGVIITERQFHSVTEGMSGNRDNRFSLETKKSEGGRGKRFQEGKGWFFQKMLAIGRKKGRGLHSRTFRGEKCQSLRDSCRGVGDKLIGLGKKGRDAVYEENWSKGGGMEGLRISGSHIT